MLLCRTTVWADNADYISIQYSGTGALKTDYTRTGKRTRLGALKDGYHSVTRYLKNNFTDGYRQDSIDLFLGNYKVDPNEGRSVACPLGKRRDLMFVSVSVSHFILHSPWVHWIMLVFLFLLLLLLPWHGQLPLIFLGSIAMFFLSLLIPHGEWTDGYTSILGLTFVFYSLVSHPYFFFFRFSLSFFLFPPSLSSFSPFFLPFILLSQRQLLLLSASQCILISSDAFFSFSCLRLNRPNISLLHQIEHSTGSFIFWISMIFIILMAIVFFGSEFVDFPKLTDVRSSKKKVEWRSKKYWVLCNFRDSSRLNE